jgi:hypothetical protein
MNELVKHAGLYLEKVEEVPCHGKSFLFTIRKKPCPQVPLETDGRYDIETYKTYQADADRLKDELTTIIKNSKKSVVGYGAAANGVVLMNFMKTPVEYVVDDNPLKQGKFIGGVRVPIYSSEYLKNDNEDLTIVVFAWNMYQDIMDKIKGLRNRQDTFVQPFPKITIS